MKMKVLVRLIHVFFLCAVLTIPLFLLSVHDASAAGGYARWILDVSFDETGASHPQGKQIVAEWTVQVEDLTGGVFASETRLLDCTRVNSVAIKGEVAILKGGYITCDMPSFADAVYQLTGHALITNERGEARCAGEVDLWARAHAKPFLIPARTHPIFNHPSFYYQISNATGPIETTLRTNMWQPAATVSTVGSPMPLTGQLDYFGTRLHECQQGECLGKHRLNQTTRITETVSYPPAPLPHLYVDATTVEIGANPQTLDTFRGIIHRSEFDPGCFSEVE